MSTKNFIALTDYAGATVSSELGSLEATAAQEFDSTDVVGRKVKIMANPSDPTEVWFQGREVTKNEILFSNGHYYLALNDGKTGNVQPYHVEGSASDGEVGWKYLHSGYASGTVVDVTDAKTMSITLDKGTELPIKKYDQSAEYYFENFQWSIWGYRGAYPSHVYMFNNRLGFVTNTQGFGSWNSMSCSDNYFDFSTEQYGQQLDTSAIVHIVGSGVQWVLAKSQLYIGSYLEEYVIGSSQPLTPTNLVLKNISNVGGANVVPLKYKDLNIFVNSIKDDVFSIGYDYTIDDYVPKSVGLLSKHLLKDGVVRMVGMNNADDNVYILTKSGNVVLLHYDKYQRILGMSRLNIGETIDITTTSSKEQHYGYVAVKRQDGRVSLESFTESYTPHTLDEQTITSTDWYHSLSADPVMTEPKTTRFACNDNVLQTFTVAEDGSVSEVAYALIGGEIIKLDKYTSDASMFVDSISSRLLLKAYEDGTIFALEKDGSYVLISKDFGETWNTTSALGYSPTLGTLPPVAKVGQILIAGDLRTCISRDGGSTWEKTEDTNLAQVADFDNLFWRAPFGGEIEYSSDLLSWTKIPDSGPMWVPYHIIVSKYDDGYCISTGGGVGIFNKKGYLFDVSPSFNGDSFPVGESKFLAFLNLSENLSSSSESLVKGFTSGKEEFWVSEQLAKTIGEEGQYGYAVITDGYSVFVYNTATGVFAKVSGEESVLIPKDNLYLPQFAGKDVYVRSGDNPSQFLKKTVPDGGRLEGLPLATYHIVSLPMVCELHTQPAFGQKVEGHQQQSISMFLRLNNSGSFSYGCSVDFDKYFDYKDWADRQQFEEAPVLYTGDCYLNIPLGYAEADNQGDNLYPNSTGVGINIKSDTPEPFNLLSIQEIYK